LTGTSACFFFTAFVASVFGASTFEAQLKAGMDTVANIKKILSGDKSVEI